MPCPPRPRNSPTKRPAYRSLPKFSSRSSSDIELDSRLGQQLDPTIVHLVARDPSRSPSSAAYLSPAAACSRCGSIRSMLLVGAINVDMVDRRFEPAVGRAPGRRCRIAAPHATHKRRLPCAIAAALAASGRRSRPRSLKQTVQPPSSTVASRNRVHGDHRREIVVAIMDCIGEETPPGRNNRHTAAWARP